MPFCCPINGIKTLKQLEQILQHTNLTNSSVPFFQETLVKISAIIVKEQCHYCQSHKCLLFSAKPLCLLFNCRHGKSPFYYESSTLPQYNFILNGQTWSSDWKFVVAAERVVELVGRHSQWLVIDPSLCRRYYHLYLHRRLMLKNLEMLTASSAVMAPLHQTPAVLMT